MPKDVLCLLTLRTNRQQTYIIYEIHFDVNNLELICTQYSAGSNEIRLPNQVGTSECFNLSARTDSTAYIRMIYKNNLVMKICLTVIE